MIKPLIPFCLTLLLALSCGPVPVILPTENFEANFCNFPLAWTVSRGSGITVAVVDSADSNRTARVMQRIAALAPEAACLSWTPVEFLATDHHKRPEIILLMTDIKTQGIVETVKVRTAQNTAILIPVFLGAVQPEQKARLTFIQQARNAGALIVGGHGCAFEIGDFSTWESWPVDLWALNVEVDGGQYRMKGSTIDLPTRHAGPVAAACAALVRASYPHLTPHALKTHLQTHARPLAWGRLRDNGWMPIDTSTAGLTEKAMAWGDSLIASYQAPCLDAALALGRSPAGDGAWCRSLLRCAEAHKTATGRGVTVAILDHLFDKDDKAFTGRTVAPGSVFDELPVWGGRGHGTHMAHELLQVAPDVQLMPVRITGPGHYGNAEGYIRGIDYAAEHGAHVISLSHAPIPPDMQADLDAAIARASEKGAVLVYIHYRGQRHDVVVPGPIEFKTKPISKASLFVIGTHFSSSFPYTWGLSPTAPVVAGVIATMKEVNPALSSQAICDVLHRAGGQCTAQGTPLLDAVKALQLARQ